MKKQIEDNAQRIQRLLDGDTISDQAREYIEHLVDFYGIDKCASLDFNNRIGLSVFENESRVQSLHYGDYGDNYHGVIDAAYCNIEDILDAAEADDEVPDWWDDDFTTIWVETDNGSRLMTKDAERLRRGN